MNFKINAEIAYTHVTSRMKQSIIAALGVAFGISMYVFINGLLKGSNDYFDKKALANLPEVRIFNDGNTNSLNKITNGISIQNPRQILDMIKKDSGVKAEAALVTSNIIYRNDSLQSIGTIYGVNILNEDKMFDIKSIMSKGKIEDLLKIKNSILIGSGIASKLNVNVNDKILVTSANGESIQMIVAGIFETGIKRLDRTKSYASISNVQYLLHQGSTYITEIDFNLKDLNKAPKYAEKYARLTGYSTEDWMSVNQTIGAGMAIRNDIALAMLITILIVAGFGIYNILNMTIYEKMKDIAILKATGFDKKDILQIFITEALMIGLSGGMAGIILGYIVSYCVSLIPVRLAHINNLPFDFHLMNFILGFLFGTITAFFAGYFPAKRASLVDPVQIIRS